MYGCVWVCVRIYVCVCVVVHACVLQDSNGWIPTQSKFNVVELLAQLAFLFVLQKNSAQSLLTIMISSIATLWKTLIVSPSFFPTHVDCFVKSITPRGNVGDVSAGWC